MTTNTNASIAQYGGHQPLPHTGFDATPFALLALLLMVVGTALKLMIR